MKYFELRDDVHVPGRWYLDNPVNDSGEEITWMFQQDEKAVHPEGRIRIPLYRAGKPLDFCEVHR